MPWISDPPVKTIFIGPAGLALVLAGCIDLPPPEGSGQPVAVESPCERCDARDLEGEVMLFVNGRLSSEAALYQANIPLDENGTYLGAALYLYDPDAECDDGTTDCRLAHLGNLRLDEALGSDSVDDDSLKKFSIRDIAWSPTHGLWGVSFDVLNDEWGIVRIDVPDWHGIGQELPLARWNIWPGEDPEPDGCYWQESVSGLGFFGDELLLGVRGMGGVGITNEGVVFRVDLDVLSGDASWCVYADDPSEDPHYYACDVLCHPYASFGAQLGIAGDLEVVAGGDAALGIVRAENADIMPLDRAELYRIDAPEGDEPTPPSGLGFAVEGIETGKDIDGLARIDGVLFGIDVQGRVWRLDEAEHVAQMHEDLGAHFDTPSQSLRIRGATRVLVEAPPDP